MYREEDFKVRPNRRPKHILDTTSSNRVYHKVWLKIEYPYRKRGGKSLPKDWKSFRRTQWRS